MPDVAANLRRVRDRIDAAATEAGRDPADVTLLAVSKTRAAEEVAHAAEAGASHFGENYVQELVDKQQALADSGLDLHWHFIGHLQRNKVRFLAPFCALIESVDSVRLAEEIDGRAIGLGRVQPVLLQVDLAGEETKFGCPEEQVGEVAERLATLPGVAWEGLMTIPPAADDPEASRPYYRRLRELREQLAAQYPGQNLRHLSMGMSHDYAVAVSEGATIVRIGTAIFGPRA
ncbi:YggS family pyridoxal phosphate-dependent enzyme [bacterium]|nr:YggS family pyridoxal phosphate-dependent enzyme [bacterium]